MLADQYSQSAPSAGAGFPLPPAYSRSNGQSPPFLITDDQAFAISPPSYSREDNFPNNVVTCNCRCGMQIPAVTINTNLNSYNPSIQDDYDSPSRNGPRRRAYSSVESRPPAATNATDYSPMEAVFGCNNMNAKEQSPRLSFPTIKRLSRQFKPASTNSSPVFDKDFDCNDRLAHVVERASSSGGNSQSAELQDLLASVNKSERRRSSALGAVFSNWTRK
ncbi:hypothetical protein HDU76_004083 [Blyttiomyces sp. JEL0837]|nr:hypothetical protein HDU76_004083 [Blyttiomyces sp. JEL0837]